MENIGGGSLWAEGRQIEGLITEDKGREAVKEGGVPLESGFYQVYVEALSSLGSVV